MARWPLSRDRRNSSRTSSCGWIFTLRLLSRSPARFDDGSQQPPFRVLDTEPLLADERAAGVLQNVPGSGLRDPIGAEHRRQDMEQAVQDLDARLVGSLHCAKE